VRPLNQFIKAPARTPPGSKIAAKRPYRTAESRQHKGRLTGLRDNGGNLSKGDPVTKFTKSSVGIIKGAALQPKEDAESDAEGIRFSHCQDVASVSRLKKSSPKAEVADQIGRGLRNVYNDVLSQPVPDRFFDLLRQLECAQGPQLKKDAP
jgi:hypothetical protein